MRVRRRGFLAGAGAAALSGCDAGGLLRAPWGEAPPAGPYLAPAGASIDPISHVLARLTFGPSPGDYGAVARLAGTPEQSARMFIEEQLTPGAIDDRFCEWRVRRFESLRQPPGELFEYKQAFLLEELTRASIMRAVLTRRQLNEVMVHFWTDHFNIDPTKGDAKHLKTADDRMVIRPHALGRFADLVRASALSPAMLWYLDGRVNQKVNPGDHPNENYARELMELHTLGVRGGYSQRDVMEAARCLTGWTVHEKQLLKTGKVEFIASKHDDGGKEVLGTRIPAGLGAKDIDRLLEIVCGHPSTARHIADKLCRRFISDDPPDEAVVMTARAFTGSQGDIKATLRALFATGAFWTSERAKFKRPFGFVVSALRACGAKTDAGRPLVEYLQRMGHAPFRFPTPDGYPEEASPWLGGLLWRWNFAAALAAGRIKGTTSDPEQLRKDFGGDENLMAHLLGRRPGADELAAYHESGQGLALALASPAFQRC